MENTCIKYGLKDLSNSIKNNQQALENSVSEIEYLERQVAQLNYQIKHAYKLEDGTYLSLEELASRYDRFQSFLEYVGNLDVG